MRERYWPINASAEAAAEASGLKLDGTSIESYAHQYGNSRK